MFVVLYVKEGITYFEAPGIDKYTHVTLVAVEQTDTKEDTVKDEDDLIDAEILGSS